MLQDEADAAADIAEFEEEEEHDREVEEAVHDMDAIEEDEAAEHVEAVHYSAPDVDIEEAEEAIEEAEEAVEELEPDYCEELRKELTATQTRRRALRRAPPHTEPFMERMQRVGVMDPCQIEGVLAQELHQAAGHELSAQGTAASEALIRKGIDTLKNFDNTHDD
eukprot:Polyplicarium_translucidae@DN2086_c0_g1_i1.p2